MNSNVEESKFPSNMDQSRVPFYADHSVIHLKTSNISNRSLHSIASILNKNFCEEYYQKSQELLKTLIQEHCGACQKCQLSTPTIHEIHELYSSLRLGRMDNYSLSESFRNMPELSESRKIYINPASGQISAEGENLDFHVKYQGALQHATVLVEALGFKKYEMSFQYEKDNFALRWKQIVNSREYAEGICKEVESLENFKFECQSEIQNLRAFVEEMENKVFSNRLGKYIEITAERDELNDDCLKAILSGLSKDKTNLYLSLNLPENPDITDNITPKLFECLRNWQSKGFSYLIMNLNETSVTLDFIDIICDKLPISLNGLWLNLGHLKIDEKRYLKLLNFLKAHHRYMEFFVIQIGIEKEMEEETFKRIQNIHQIKERLKLFSAIGGVSQKLEKKIKESFLHFGGGELQIKFKPSNLKNKSLSVVNQFNSRDESMNAQPQQFNSDSKDYATNIATQGDSDGSRPGFSTPILNESGGDKVSGQKSLNSGYTQYAPKNVQCDDFNSC